MEGKIFSFDRFFAFDLQRFDGGWSLQAGQFDKWSYSNDGSATIASIEGADKKLTLSMVGSGSGTISLTSDAGASMLSSSSYNFLDAGTASLPLYFSIPSNNITSIVGGSGADSLFAGDKGVYLFGGGGADSLVGGGGKDTFVYDGQGSDSIGNYESGDIVSLSAFPGVASVSTSGGNGENLVLYLTNGGTTDSLTFVGGGSSTVKAVSGNDNTFYYTKDYIMNADQTAVSLTPAATTYDADSAVLSINGAAATDSLTINGNGKDNYIIGSASKANTIYGGAGADFVSLSANSSNKDIYVYSSGKDTVKGLGSSGIVSLSNQPFVTSGSNLESLDSATGFKLTFSKGNMLTFDGSTIASLKSDTQTYVYTSTAISVKGAGSTGDSITLGGSFDTSEFNGSSFKLVDATAVDRAISIKGGESDSYLISTGEKGGSLDGGKGNNTLQGGGGVDYFFYSGGKDTVKNYTYDSDVVSLTASTFSLPTALNDSGAKFSNSNFNISLGADSVLTFLNSSKVDIRAANGNDTYHYEKDRIIVNNNRITLGSEFINTTFNVNKISGYDAIASIDASAFSINGGLNILGNTDLASSIISAKTGGTITGGEKDDYIQAATGISENDTLILNGNDGGNDTLVGGNSKDIFVYYGGADSIKSYDAGDWVSVVSGNVDIANVGISSLSGDNLVFNFDGSDSLSIAGGTTFEGGVSLQSGSSTYVYRKDATFTYNQKSVTLTADYADSVFGGSSLGTYGTITAIDASLFNKDSGISIVGNDNGNVIIGSLNKSNSLTGGTGKDIFTGGNESDLFYYSGGKDVINDFVGGSVSSGSTKSDRLSISPGYIASAKSTSSKLTFTIDKDGAVTLNGSDIELVSLQGGGYLTKNGYVSLGSAEGAMSLFSSAKGRIDLNEDTLYSGASIKSVNASTVKSQSVTLVGSSLGGSFLFNESNNKRDIFEYNGGNVSISGYESGKDRLNLGEGAIAAFSIASDPSNLLISVSGFTDDPTNSVISIAGGDSKELMIRQGGSNFYKKMVLNEAGVFLNKLKKPTEATVTASVDKGFTADTNEKNSIKKIYVAEGVSGVSIQAGGKNKTLIDASAASGVSLYGGAKNDKLIGSTDYADTFVYTGGKDVIQNFINTENVSDSISFADDVANISTAKITAGSKAASFKFTTKNTLSLKAPNKASITSINFNGTDYKFGKNWYGELAEGATSPKAVSLTSVFSGTFKANDKVFGDDTLEVVDGHLVTKNLKFKGTSENESLVGADDAKAKTSFRGGGGDDTLVGGSGKDTFFYVKKTSGDTEIQNFDFTNDKLKIASGSISTITTISGGIKFEMNRNDSDATFNITSFTKDNVEDTTSKILIHANNTYYWFTETPMEEKNDDGNEKLSASPGELVTTTDKISKTIAQSAKDYAILELGYSTNLANSGVAKKFSNYTFNSGGTISEKDKSES